MTFWGINNQTIGLEIASYEFPEATEIIDANWLNISLNVKCKFGNWNTVYPSLTTWDIENLTNWFDKLSKDTQPERTSMYFTEPNLSFDLLNEFNADKKMIRINFDLEFRPPNVSLIDFDVEYFVDIHADNVTLKNIARELTKELGKYPIRMQLGVG